MKKFTLFIASLFLTLGAMAQEPVLELTANQIGTTYPKQLSDDDAEKINAAHTLLGNLVLPKNLIANTFVIGTSETGKNGTYRVYKTVEV